MYKGMLRIAGTGSYLPAKIVRNEELVSAEDCRWVEQHIGVRERRVASEQESVAFMATEAARNAMLAANVSPDAVDMVIVATATPGRLLPAIACEVQASLGLSAAAFDMQGVCAGFLYALTVASQMISGGARNVLVIGADRFSTITDWSRRDCVYFGDGAGAALVQRSNGSRNFVATLGCDGGQKLFSVESGEQYFTMHAKELRRFAVQTLPAVIRSVLSETGLSATQIKYVFPHQASTTLLRDVFAEADIDYARVATNIERYGNTAAGSIPIVLDEYRRAGRIQAQDHLLLVAIGAGMVWGAALHQWQ